MAASFLAGAVAGWAIAIPVGAIAVLIVELGIRRGFRVALAAAAGAASADGTYAAIAAIGGAAIAVGLAPLEAPLRVIAVVALAAIGGRALVRALGDRRSLTRGVAGESDVSGPAGPLATYLRFLGLTLLNPQTVVYFAALILGLPDLGRGAPERAAFVAGAFLASLSWQIVLAAVSAIAHHRLPPGFQVAVSVAGGVVILGFAVRLALDLAAA